MKLFIVLVGFSILSVTLYGGTNRLVSGQCTNGRTWFSNIEFDDNGRFVCAYGADCAGRIYNNCPSGGGSPKMGVVVDGGMINISVTNGPAWVTIHNTANGTNVVYDFGLVYTSASVSVELIGDGDFTVTAQSAFEYGDATDATIITL